jgi:hypothetical protein
MASRVRHAMISIGALSIVIAAVTLAAVAVGGGPSAAILGLRGGTIWECADSGVSCTNATLEALEGTGLGYAHCGSQGGSSGGGGFTTSDCGAPPCQATVEVQHACMYGACEEDSVMTCSGLLEDPDCEHAPVGCGEAVPGICTSVRTCTTEGCSSGARCQCDFGACEETGGEPVDCTPQGCGIAP